jgi:hypothetical protein
MSRWFAVLFLAFISLTAALAQQPSDPATKEDVQKLFEVQNSRKTFDSIMTVMKQQMPAVTRAAIAKQLPNATPEETARLNAFMSDSLEKMFQNMPFDELMQASMPVYQHHFTHGEMQKLIQFYASPVGKKLLAEMPAIISEQMQASAPIIQKWTAAQMADLQVRAEEYARTLKDSKRQVAPPTQPARAIPASLSQPLH